MRIEQVSVYVRNEGSTGQAPVVVEWLHERELRRVVLLLEVEGPALTVSVDGSHQQPSLEAIGKRSSK